MIVVTCLFGVTVYTPVLCKWQTELQNYYHRYMLPENLIVNPLFKPLSAIQANPL